MTAITSTPVLRECERIILDHRQNIFLSITIGKIQSFILGMIKEEEAEREIILYLDSRTHGNFSRSVCTENRKKLINQFLIEARKAHRSEKSYPIWEKLSHLGDPNLEKPGVKCAIL